ncbi:MAG: NAD(P)/FAD-dependent oxidoreductase [Clostridia bacterium]|nr:NAD(P)/FAD-dependent oxidoreductase [Clostridia bacterium]
MKHIIVIGGGPAGMMAAITAAQNGNKVELIEKNEKLGKKLFITGKGRCNLTNASEPDVFFQNVIHGKKFMYSSFYSYTNEAVMDFFETRGLHLKTERGNRVFPESDHSSDVIRILEQQIRHSDLPISVRLNTKVKELITTQKEEQSCIRGVVLSDGTKITGDAVIVATGGVSYPSCGSTGDGILFAKTLGHQIEETEPSLVPLVVEESWITELQGLSLKNVSISISDQGKQLYQGFGEMLFTHFGVSGPLILSASSYLSNEQFKHKPVLSIDLKPALDEQQLDERILRDFHEMQNKQLKNCFSKLLPTKLIPVFLAYIKIPQDKLIHSITREERKIIVSALKNFRMTITGTRGFSEAIITRGGVSLKEVNPKTMESKLVKGLYFAGEVLDLDALTGGFNLQIAWSTGYAAGNGI